MTHDKINFVDVPADQSPADLWRRSNPGTPISRGKA